MPHLNQDNIYEISEKDIDDLDSESLMKVEADVFWCLSKLVDGI